MFTADHAYQIFRRSIAEYHKADHVDAPMRNPFADGTPDALLYRKNWIDTVQWHLEDIIRTDLPPESFVAVKRRIDASNQDRTDTVERLDDVFLDALRNVTPRPDARLNSETPAWLLDRMSILELKIWHMREQAERPDTDEAHRHACRTKLAILEEQESDMGECFDALVREMQAGTCRMKVYRQMKMYNDATLNPMLYAKKENA